MLDDGNALNMSETPDAPPPEEKSNRTFLIVGGVMAGLVFLTLVCLAIYFLVIRPRSAATRNAAQATIEAGNAQAIQQVTLTAQAALWTPTLPPTSIPVNTSTAVPKTATVSPTPVISIPLSSPAATATFNQGTVVALQTQLAFQMLSTAAAIQAMPQTGFFDEVGLPSMIILALALVVIIFLVRRMRKSPAK
jgi:heme/copper-type cytochrome/quinol oxidase subunit 2